VSEIEQNQLHRDILTGTAFALFLSVAALYLPVIGLLIGFLVPLPFIFYRIKIGRLFSGVILFAVLVILLIIFRDQGLHSGVFFLYFGLTGFILAEAFAQNLSIEKTVLGTVAVLVGVCVAALLVYAFFSPQSVWGLMQEYFRKNIELTLGFYKEIGVPPEQIEILQASQDAILYVFMCVIPGIFVAFTIVTVWINLLMVRPILARRNLFCPDFGALNRWKSPERLVWFAIGAGLLLLVPLNGLKMFGINIVIVLTVIYLFQGLAIISYYFQKKRFPPVLRKTIYLLLAVQQLLLLVVVIAGLLDMWVDFRRLKTEETGLQS